MDALLLAVAVSLSAPAAEVRDKSDLVPLFIDTCMGDGPALTAVDTAAASHGWQRNEAMSGELSRMPTQSILSTAWKTTSSEAADSPWIEIGASRITDRMPLEKNPSETCAIAVNKSYTSGMVDQLEVALNTQHDTRNNLADQQPTITWRLRTDPLDFVQLSEGRTQLGIVTSITRGRVRIQRTP